MGVGHVCAKERQAIVDRTLKSQEQGISDDLKGGRLGTCLIVGHMASLGCPMAQFQFGLFPRRDSPAELLSSMCADQKQKLGLITRTGAFMRTWLHPPSSLILSRWGSGVVRLESGCCLFVCGSVIS